MPRSRPKNKGVEAHNEDNSIMAVTVKTEEEECVISATSSCENRTVNNTPVKHEPEGHLDITVKSEHSGKCSAIEESQTTINKEQMENLPTNTAHNTSECRRVINLYCRTTLKEEPQMEDFILSTDTGHGGGENQEDGESHGHAEITVEIEDDDMDATEKTIKQQTKISNSSLVCKVKAKKQKQQRKALVPQVFRCGVCGKDIKHLLSYQEHLRIHTGERPYECPTCHKRFIRSADLIKHKLVHSDQRPYPCLICGKRFKLQGDVTKHKVVHEDKYPFVCSQCGTGFKRAACLTKHERAHSTECPFGCTICGRTFKWESSLKYHMMVHKKEKPFVCPKEGCEMRFTHRSSFLQHSRAHDRPQQSHCCRICGRSYNRRSNALKHERSHSCVKVKPANETLSSNRHSNRAHTNI